MASRLLEWSNFLLRQRIKRGAYAPIFFILQQQRWITKALRQTLLVPAAAPSTQDHAVSSEHHLFAFWYDLDQAINVKAAPYSSFFFFVMYFAEANHIWVWARFTCTLDLVVVPRIEPCGSVLSILFYKFYSDERWTGSFNDPQKLLAFLFGVHEIPLLITLWS